ncbi:MAG: hypothetical protein ACHQX3_00545 [Nitrospirales bacterium]|jgi:hypothetical protein
MAVYNQGLDRFTLEFLNHCEQAQFDTGGHVHFRIKLSPVLGGYYTEISNDGGTTFDPIYDEIGTIFYDTFAEALNAIVEHKREM